MKDLSLEELFRIFETKNAVIDGDTYNMVEVNHDLECATFQHWFLSGDAICPGCEYEVWNIEKITLCENRIEIYSRDEHDPVRVELVDPGKGCLIKRMAFTMLADEMGFQMRHTSGLK